MTDIRVDPLVADVPEQERRLLQTTDAIAARIGFLMRERGLNQTDLAKRIKKSKSYVSRVLSGTKNLTLKTIAEFESVLGGDVVTVLAWEAPYPRRRRRSSTSTESTPEMESNDDASGRENTPAEGLTVRLPRALCDRLEDVAASQGASIDALVTLWVAEHLMGEKPAKIHRSLWSQFPEARAVEVHLPVGFSSSPLGAGKTQPQQTCVDRNGDLVLGHEFASFDPDRDVHDR